MTGARKRDPVTVHTGKCVLALSDMKRKKRPTRKSRTPEENVARRGNRTEVEKQRDIVKCSRRSVKTQKVHHIVSIDASD